MQSAATPPVEFQCDILLVSDDGCRPSHSVRYPRSQSSYQSSYFTVFHMLPLSKPSQSIVKHIGSEPISHPLSLRPRENIHPVTAARPVEVVLHGGGAASESVAGLSLLGSGVPATTSSSTDIASDGGCRRASRLSRRSVVHEC
jgi:hypothetical protein